MLFDIGRTTIAGRPGLTVRGELDLSTAPLLATVVEQQLAAAPPALVIDLTGTVFIDSSGARQLVRSTRAAQSAEAEVYVICPRTNRGARLVIDLLDLGAIVPIVESAAAIPPGFAQQDARP